MTLVVRPARLEDVKRYYPDINASCRAWVAEIDGVVEGFIGLILTRPFAALVSVFSETLRPHLRTMPVLKAIKRVSDIVTAHNAPLLAVQEPGEPTSPVILLRLRFEPAGEIEGDHYWRYGG